MGPLKVIIIDDEPDCTELLALQLNKYCPNILVQDICFDPKMGIQKIKQLSPDAVFLDINMPAMSGFDMLNHFGKNELDVIFTTAHSEYALQALRLSAVDFLLKPINTKSLVEAVERLQQRMNKKQSSQYDFLFEQINALKTNRVEKIAVPTFDGITFIELKSISYIKSDNIYADIIFVNGKKVTTTNALKKMEEMLEALNFMRVHKSFIINLSNIRKFKKEDGGFVIMENGDHVSIARSRKVDFINRISELKI